MMTMIKNVDEWTLINFKRKHYIMYVIIISSLMNHIALLTTIKFLGIYIFAGLISKASSIQNCK